MTIEKEVEISEAANNGDVNAMLQYAKMLLGLSDRVGENGITTVRYCDISNDGIAYLKKAARLGNNEAEELLTRIKNNEVHIVTEPEYLFEKAMRCIADDARACDYNEVADLLYEAADKGRMYKDSYSDVYKEIADMCSDLDSENYICGQEIKEWLGRLSDATFDERLHMFALIRFVSSEGDENWSEYPVDNPKFTAGLEWVRKDADAGNPISQYQYGEILIWACDIEKTMNEGLEYLKRSCENGYARAAVELGLLYENMAGSDWGDVFQPDLNEARKWFEKGVDLGSMFACDKLGELLYYDAVNAFGRISSGVSIEGEAALIDRTFELTKRAADAGFSCSQMRLAVMYTDGMGVARDELLAKECLLKAENHGSSIARDCIDLIVKSGLTLNEAIDKYRDRIS